MEQLPKVGELERKALAEQDSLILLPESNITLLFNYIHTLISVCRDIPYFPIVFLLVWNKIFCFECEERNSIST
jgi:hypothetical protein